LFSIESYVGFGNHRRRRHKKRHPNRQYCWIFTTRDDPRSDAWARDFW
jgi:hypothetical protein